VGGVVCKRKVAGRAPGRCVFGTGNSRRFSDAVTSLAHSAHATLNCLSDVNSILNSQSPRPSVGLLYLPGSSFAMTCSSTTTPRMRLHPE
jgi:hypothetical protein